MKTWYWFEETCLRHCHSLVSLSCSHLLHTRQCIFMKVKLREVICCMLSVKSFSRFSSDIAYRFCSDSLKIQHSPLGMKAHSGWMRKRSATHSRLLLSGLKSHCRSRPYSPPTGATAHKQQFGQVSGDHIGKTNQFLKMCRSEVGCVGPIGAKLRQNITVASFEC